MKVVQCWDDGVATDIAVTEIFRKYGAKATFNLCIGIHQEERVNPSWTTDPAKCTWNKGFSGGRVGLKEMRQVYDGFQVASHCWKHENAGKLPDEEFLKAAMDCRKYLEDLFERECRGFAWPCGQTTQTTADLLREAGFAYGRTTGYTTDVTRCADTMLLSSSCHFMDPAFIQKYEAAKETGVFYFWGHTYEMFGFDQLLLQLEHKIRYITEDPDSEWADVIDIVPLCKA